MNQPPSRMRLLALAILLVVETALVISLRVSGWVGTGQHIRSFMTFIAIALPFAMTAILLYRVRVPIRRGQFSLRALMALTLVVASYLALLPLFETPDKPNTGPSPISKSIKFEVFTAAPTGTPNGASYTDPDTGTMLAVAGPPIITSADVLTIELTRDQNHVSTLNITLSPAGGNKLFKATTAASGSRLVVITDGKVLSAPVIRQPVGNRFRLTSNRIHTEGNDVFNALTLK